MPFMFDPFVFSEAASARTPAVTQRIGRPGSWLPFTANNRCSWENSKGSGWTERRLLNDFPLFLSQHP